MGAENLTTVETPNVESEQTDDIGGVQDDKFITERSPYSGPGNTIFVGPKPFMNYVTAVVMQFTTKNATDVIIKARGKFISRAVDIAEISSKRFLDKQVRVSDIRIDSEEFQNKESRTVRVSTIEILLEKKS